jgi:excisionase family DNA binding protein
MEVLHMEQKTTFEQENINENTAEYISVDDMAKMLKVARATAYQLTKVNGFPCFYIGKRIIIPLSAFNVWAAKQAENQAIYFEK